MTSLVLLWPSTVAVWRLWSWPWHGLGRVWPWPWTVLKVLGLGLEVCGLGLGLMTCGLINITAF